MPISKMLLAIVLVAHASGATKEKKPKAPKPEACMETAESDAFCFTPLYWSWQDSTIYSEFQNRSAEATVSTLMFTFTLKRAGDNGLIVGSAHGSLFVSVPPGGRAEVSARVTGDPQGWMIESVHVWMNLSLEDRKAIREGDAAVYPPLFQFGQRSWNKANGY